MQRLKLVAHQKLVTQKELERILGVSPMTIYLWRKGDNPLPHRAVPTQGGRNRIFYPVDEVVHWLAVNKPNLHKKLEEVQSDSNCRHCGAGVESRRIIPDGIERATA